MKNTGQTVTRTNHIWGGSSRKTRLGAVLAILGCALLHDPIQALAVVPGSGAASLAWDSSVSSGVSGYRVYMGTSKGNYTSSVVAGNATTTTISGLAVGTTYFFAVKAYDSSGVESAFSNEISFVPGGAALQLSVNASGQAVLTVKGLSGHTYNIEATQNLSTWTTLGSVTVGSGGSTSYTDATAPAALKRFYRTRDLQP